MTIRTQSLKLAFFGAVLATGLTAGQTASAITLNTTALKSNATLTFEYDAYYTLIGSRNTIAPLGNTVFKGFVQGTNPEGDVGDVPVFEMPITKASVSIGWDLKISADSGQSSRSALILARGSRSAVLANFEIDFKQKLVLADLITGGVTTKKMPLYTFEVIVPQKISLKNLVLNMTETIGELRVTPTSKTALGDALGLTLPVQDALAELNFGQIAIEVTSYKRSPKISDTPFTVNDIPATPAP